MAVRGLFAITLFVVGVFFSFPINARNVLNFSPVHDGDFVKTIRGIDFYSNRSKDNFANSLASEYKSFSLHKAQVANDFNEANYFAKKALSAYHGDHVRPDNVYLRKLSLSNIVEISNEYEEFLKILGTDIWMTYPQLMAEAQVKFDCWIESEEKFDVKQAAVCKGRFKKAKELLVSKIRPECADCKKELVKKPIIDIGVSKFDGRLIPIPKWPNVPMVSNNPPRTSMELSSIKTSEVINNQQDAEIVRIRMMLEEMKKSNIKSVDIEKINILLSQINSSISNIGRGGVPQSNLNVSSLGASDIDGLKFILIEIQKKMNNGQDMSGVEEKLQFIKSRLDQMSDVQQVSKTQLNVIEEKIDNLGFESENADMVVVGQEVIEQVDDGLVEDEEIEYEIIEEVDYKESEVFDRSSDILPFEIYFDWNNPAVDYKFFPQLNDISQKALSSKENIIVQGHTDTSGTPEYNKKLSNNRANNVAKMLESYGIPREKIIIQAMGDTDLKIQTERGVKNAANRRVVIK